MFGFISTSVTSYLNHTYYSTIADLHNVQFTVALALRFSVSISRLVATDLNTETSTSDHYGVFFLPFLIQSTWSLGTQVKPPSTTPPAFDCCCPLEAFGANLQKTRHVIPTQRVHWGADCCLATRYKHSCYCCLAMRWHVTMIFQPVLNLCLQKCTVYMVVNNFYVVKHKIPTLNATFN
jgi:hypothetical protein